MGKPATNQNPPVQPPSIHDQDAPVLRTYIEAMIAAGAVATLVTWLIAFITRLWKTQNDMIERLRSRSRRNGDNEKFGRLQAMLPGIHWDAANDNQPKPRPKPSTEEDKRRRGKNENRDEHGRSAPPAHLPRIEEKIAVPQDERGCQRCGLEMVLKEWIPREILDRIPAKWFVRLVLRERLSCACCQRESVAAEPVDTVIDGGLLGTDVLVDALVDHVGNAVSFERMANEAKAQSVPIPANTLARGVHALIDRLQPVVDHIFQQCVVSHVVGSDATSMRVLDPTVARGIRHATLWNLLGDNRWSFFGYAPTAHGKHLTALLKGCTLDVLQCDGASTLNDTERVSRKRAGCHSHGRSKLVDALKGNDERALTPLLIYMQLFAIEAESKALRERHSDRLARRVLQSRPLILQLWAWVDAHRPDVEPRSKLGIALTYLSNQRARLELFLQDGSIAMTNNAVERELRTHVLNRKTWMFCGNEENARRTAAALTVIRTCRLLGVDVRAYLRAVIPKLLGDEKDGSKLWPENFVSTATAQKAA